MKLRRRGANVGTYVDPPVKPVAPVERVVDDGVVISTAAVRMAVKNRIIIGALRDHLDFEVGDLSEVARQEFLQLAGENEATADRLESEPDGSDPDGPDNASTARRREEHERRPEVHRLLATALRAAGNDDDTTEVLVRRARDDAADELGREVSAQLLAHQFEPEPDYEQLREARLRDFVDIDLSALRAPSPGRIKPASRWARIPWRGGSA